ncbi:MAG: efflux RND transporter periplasmic adaptor subunit [Candidatus Omnitrophota bacterium]
MKRVIVIIISAAILFFIGFRAYQNYQAKKAAMVRVVPEKVIPVNSGKATYQDITDKFKASGSLQANSEVTLYSKVGGKIIANLVTLGTPVHPGMTVATVNRDEIGYQYNTFEVKSDVKGVVSKVLQNPGAMITPNIPLLTLVDIDIVKAVINVDELNIRFMRVGETLPLSVQAYPGEIFNARVTNISPVCNPQTRTVEVELRVANGTHRLKPGMYVEAEVVAGTRKALVLPVAAVVERMGSRYVFVIQGDRAQLVSVKVGKIIENTIEIVSGLTGNEPVVISGADQLEDKTKVNVVESPSMPNPQGEKAL